MDQHELDDRFDHHPPRNNDVVLAHETIRSTCKGMSMVLNNVLQDGRYKALAMTALEEVMHWANAGIAIEGPQSSPREV